MPKSKPAVHIVPKGDAWAVQRSGSGRASRVVTTQAEAAEIGRQLATKDRTELLIHGKDGRIRSKDNYGPEPTPNAPGQTEMIRVELPFEMEAPLRELAARHGMAPKEFAQYLIEREWVAEQSAGEPQSFLKTARSLNLEGPSDWSANLDEYLYGPAAQAADATTR